MIQLAKKISWAEQKPPGFVGRTSQRPNCSFGKSVKLLGKRIPFSAGFWFVACCCQSWWLHGLQYCGREDFPKDVGRAPYWEGVWPCLDPWDVVRLRTSCSCWNVLGEYGKPSELFLFLIKRKPVAVTKAVLFKPVVLAQGVCAAWFAPFGSRR